MSMTYNVLDFASVYPRALAGILTSVYPYVSLTSIEDTVVLTSLQASE